MMIELSAWEYSVIENSGKMKKEQEEMVSDEMTGRRRDVNLRNKVVLNKNTISFVLLKNECIYLSPYILRFL